MSGRVLMHLRKATKDRAEKEDERVDQKRKPAPKAKPPRYDSRTKALKVDDPDLDKDDKDLSMNYKDIGGSEHALDEAICLVAMRFRGITPDAQDLMLVKASVGEADLTDPREFPRLASETFKVIDAKYKHARLRRVMPTKDGRRFTMGPPLEPRDETDPLWPVWTQVRPMRPAYVTEGDVNAIIAAAKERIDLRLYKYNRDVALREALDMTLATLNNGRFEHMLDAPTYTAVLVKLSGSDMDLTEDTYVPTQSHNPDLKYIQDKPFDPYQWWGRPAE